MLEIQPMKTQPTFGSFLQFLFSPFFRNWWAALTGCASIFAMYITPSSGITLSGGAMMTATFVGLTLVFIALSVVGQGWQLYTRRLDYLQVKSFERNRDMPGGWVFVLVGGVDLSVGTVIDIHKKAGAAEVPLSLVRIVSQNSCGAYQATPVGKINPTHIKEHSTGGLRPMDLVVRTSIDLQRIKEVANDLG